MSLEQKIDTLTASIDKLIETMKGGITATVSNTAAATAATTAKTEAAKPTRGRPAKAKVEAAAPPADDGDDGLGLGDDDDGLGLGGEEEEEEEEEIVITEEQLVAKFRELKASKGKDACVAVLTKLGQANVLTIPAEKRADAIKLVEKALKGK